MGKETTKVLGYRNPGKISDFLYFSFNSSNEDVLRPITNITRLAPGELFKLELVINSIDNSDNEEVFLFIQCERINVFDCYLFQINFIEQ